MTDLADGERIEVKGSAAKPYVVRNVGGVYSCSCPAWRNQPAPIERRSCKHIRRLRGDAAETERIGSAAPVRGASGQASNEEGPPLLLADKWDNSTDISDWWMSEKLDGVRAYWDGKKFLSRQGNVYLAPAWFVEGLPDIPLDGELWLGRKKFQRTVSIVRRQDQSDHWKEIRFRVFDAPGESTEEQPFEQRIATLDDLFASRSLPFASRLEHRRCESVAHLKEELARIEALGGEGLMLREPGSLYVAGRSSTLLKVKTFHDAEAVVLDHQPGKGKFKGKLGALVVQLEDGIQFNVGTGFTEVQRDNPPPPGSVITFRYQEVSDGGVPRFPSFVRVHTVARGLEVQAPAPAKAAPAAAAASSLVGARHFELEDDKSSKFWEVAVVGCEVTVRYGRIGSNGQTKVKTFADDAAAAAFADRQIAQKTGKGYREVG